MARLWAIDLSGKEKKRIEAARSTGWCWKVRPRDAKRNVTTKLQQQPRYRYIGPPPGGAVVCYTSMHNFQSRTKIDTGDLAAIAVALSILNFF